EVLTLDYDNGFVCPNIFYKEGEDCLVFLKKRAGGGSYETLGLYNGKFSIQGSDILNFYLFEKNPADIPLRSSHDLKEVIARLRAEIENPTTPITTPINPKLIKTRYLNTPTGGS
ncbi:MAG: hypothetical protein ABIP97_09275, partial [Chthoniobacterales bacterium]